MTETKQPATKTKSKSTAKTTKAKKAPKSTTASKASSEKSNATKAGATIQSGRLDQVREAVKIPVGAARGAANRVGAFVSPVSNRVSDDLKVAALRARVEDILREAEKRGGAVLSDKRLKELGGRAERIQSDLTKALDKLSNWRP